jgi:hypothetical protein
MPPDRAALALLVLFAWVAVWWLAVRVVFGRFGVFEWVPVTVVAATIPAVIADQIAVNASVLSEWGAILCWGCVGVLIDIAWIGRRFARRSKRPQAR